MNACKAWLAAAAGLGFLGLSAPAEAQYYPYPPQRGHYYQQQPSYVPPRVLRKQRQLERRLYEKYGYVQPAPQYYRQPRYNPYQAAPYGYGSPYRGRVYPYGYGGGQPGGSPIRDP